jgi:hypothetical protein
MCVGLLVYDLVFVGIRIEMYGVAGEMCVTGTGRPAKAESTGHFFFVCVCVCGLFGPGLLDVTPPPSSKRAHDFQVTTLNGGWQVEC